MSMLNVASVVLSLLASASATAPRDQLAAAVSAYENLDDERARALLTTLLKHRPEDSIAARAYLYLGLVDFNDLDSVKARREFERALELDPAVEPPLSSSLKTRMLFAEARRAVSQELDRSAIAPATALSATSAPEPPRHSHGLAWGLGTGGVVSGGVAVYGLTQILAYNSIANQANAKQGAVGSAQIAGPLSSAKVWQPVASALGAVGAGLLLAAVLTW